MYDPEETVLVFNKLYGIVRDYILKPEDVPRKQYAALLALEDIRTCMYDTEMELLKRMIAEKEKQSEPNDD